MIKHKLMYAKEIQEIVSSHREVNDALPGAVIRAKLKGEVEKAEANRLGIKVADKRDEFGKKLQEYIMEQINFPTRLGEE